MEPGIETLVAHCFAATEQGQLLLQAEIQRERLVLDELVAGCSGVCEVLDDSAFS